MKIFDIFRNKKIDALEQKVSDLQEKLTATSDLSDSLIGFYDGRTYYFDTNKKNTFAEHYTIYRGIDLLASLGSGLPVNIYRGDNLVPPETYLPNGFDLYNPNPFMSLNELNYAALVYFFYRGEYMVEIVEEPFFHLMPINPQKMTRTNDGINWKYDNGRTRRIILNDNLIYVKLLNPDDDQRGLSPIDVVKADIMNEQSAIEYNTAWFKNFGKVGGMFYDTESKARPEDMEKVVNQFEATKSGTYNTGKTIGLPRGIRYEEFSQTMAEMQYLESRKDIRDRILAILGIHKSLFGVTDQVNRSVSEEATRMLWLHQLKPKMKRVQDAWNRMLFKKRFPIYTYKYDYSDVAELKQAVETVDKQARLLKFLGYTTNEINEVLKLGMEEIDDPALNVRALPTGMIPFSEYDMGNDEENATAMVKVDNIRANELLLEYFSDDETKEIQSKSNEIKKNRYVLGINKVKRASEKRMASKLGKFFANELGDVMKIVLGSQQADSTVDINSILAKVMNQLNLNKTVLMALMKPLYEQASLESDEFAINYIGATDSPVANFDIVMNMTNKITNITNHTYRLIRTQVKAGIDSGETIDQIADRIKKVYKFNSARSRMIARTETQGIVNRTTDKRYLDAGITEKEWLSSHKSTSRPEHLANERQGAIPFNQAFQNGQMHPGEGSASQVINCACTLIPHIK